MENAKTNQSGKQANRCYKNSVFTLLFSEKEKLLELYNAVSGQNYPENTEIEIITLSDVLFMERINDIAFVLDDKLVVLIEHQSTVNENMPLRMLLYMAKEYQKITGKKDLYKKRIVEIPTPEFIVLYNGKEEFPDFKELKLSDAFKCKRESCFLELVVKVYNINKGRNAEMSERSPSLNGYSELVAEVNKNSNIMSHEEAIKAAIKTCMSKNILLYFLEKHSYEVENMLLTEWNWDDALAVAKEEGKEEARAEALKENEAKLQENEAKLQESEAKLQNVLSLLESSVSLEEAKRKLGLL
ncbi:MAG: Rpn family recombination-promoting nuclease/putative transposase [Fibromonadales bacterium]|nr:Rpn family recombination-promoting nuclease/putative transposase [Fibromonadales bacterium]